MKDAVDDAVRDLVSRLNLPGDAGELLRDVVYGLKPGAGPAAVHPTIVAPGRGEILFEEDDFRDARQVTSPTVLPIDRTSATSATVLPVNTSRLARTVAREATPVSDEHPTGAPRSPTPHTMPVGSDILPDGTVPDFAAGAPTAGSHGTMITEDRDQTRSGASEKTPTGRRRLTRRFEQLGQLGAGGMGEVFRVLDRDFNRLLALKVIRSEFAGSSRALSRFVAEAQVTAQLQHPGIVPVHEMGRLPDGRMYFAMREVRGRDFGSQINEVHRARVHGLWREARSGWTFRRLVDAFLTVCNTVAYAHSRRVIHRDLKPENILVGDFGEVLVVDWGLARVLDRAEEDDEIESIVTQRTRDASKATVVGSVAGTPAYMPVEQATGDRARQGPQTDVYSLGACLFELLSGRPPFAEGSPDEILAMITEGVQPELPPDPEIPTPLRQICERAMSREPHDRHEHAGLLAHEIEEWLAGARRREQALEQLRQAQDRARNIERLQARAAALREEADRLLAGIAPNAPTDKKKSAWARIDEAKRLDHGAEVIGAVAAQLASAALAQSPDLPEAHDFLADQYQRSHAAAEARGNSNDAERYRIMLQAHDRGRFARYLQGDGAITLVTDPPEADVEVFRYVERDRRQVLEATGIRGTTPLLQMRVPMGSYLLQIRAPGRIPVNYPVHIRRLDHWDGVAPGDSDPTPIQLPTADQVDVDEVYVPAGWFWCGADPERGGLPRERVWVDAFVILRHPVSNGEYLEFLNDLVRRWRETEAQQSLPGTTPGFPRFEPDRSGVWTLGRDNEGRPYGVDWPVVSADWRSAVAYATWRTIRESKSWALPMELQWEKAARGVDGRTYPWGNYFDPTWACMVESQGGKAHPVPIGAFPEDDSPYGVRGLAGNVRDWCRDAYLARGPRVRSDGRMASERTVVGEGPSYRAVRGGCWSGRVEDGRAAWRGGHTEDAKLSDVGVRLVRKFEPGSGGAVTRAPSEPPKLS